MKRNERMKGLVSAEIAAGFLGIRLCTIYEWVAQERVPHIRLGRALRFDLNRLKRWVAERAVEPRSEEGLRS